jgi:hypothetical protein
MLVNIAISYLAYVGHNYLLSLMSYSLQGSTPRGEIFKLLEAERRQAGNQTQYHGVGKSWYLCVSLLKRICAHFFVGKDSFNKCIFYFSRQLIGIHRDSAKPFPSFFFFQRL